MTGRWPHLEKRQLPGTIEVWNVFLLHCKFTTSSYKMLDWFSNTLKSSIHVFFFLIVDLKSTLPYIWKREIWPQHMLSTLVFLQPCFLHSAWWFIYSWEVLGFYNMAFEFRVPVAYMFTQSSTMAYATFLHPQSVKSTFSLAVTEIIIVEVLCKFIRHFSFASKWLKQWMILLQFTVFHFKYVFEQRFIY